MVPHVLRYARCFAACVFYWTAVNGLADQRPLTEDAALPSDVQLVWDMSEAYHEATARRERICINGLWRWQPAEAESQQVPKENWGYFKVPGCWPGITDYMQKDSQTVYVHPSWRTRKLGDLVAAWYEREFTVPPSWSGRRITLNLEYLNSYAVAYVDGEEAGEAWFPGGEVDLTAHCDPGHVQQLSLLVVAMPLKGVMRSYTDTASAREVKGTVARSRAIA
jgi:beta-galactosidase